MSRSNTRCRQHNVSLIFNTDNFINWQWPLFREFSKATWWPVKESNRELNRKISNTNRWRHGCFKKSCANFANMKRARCFMPFLNLEDSAKTQITQVQNSMPFYTLNKSTLYTLNKFYTLNKSTFYLLSSLLNLLLGPVLDLFLPPSVKLFHQFKSSCSHLQFVEPLLFDMSWGIQNAEHVKP